MRKPFPATVVPVPFLLLHSHLGLFGLAGNNEGVLYSLRSGGRAKVANEVNAIHAEGAYREPPGYYRPSKGDHRDVRRSD